MWPGRDTHLAILALKVFQWGECLRTTLIVVQYRITNHTHVTPLTKGVHVKTVLVSSTLRPPTLSVQRVDQEVRTNRSGVTHWRSWPAGPVGLRHSLARPILTASIHYTIGNSPGPTRSGVAGESGGSHWWLMAVAEAGVAQCHMMIDARADGTRTWLGGKLVEWQCFIQAPFGGKFSPNIETYPPRIFGHACREAKNNVNTRLTSLTKCLLF